MTVSTLRREGDSYLLERDGELVAKLDIDRRGHQAVLHHQVFQFGPDVLCELRGYFARVKSELRAEGVEQLVAMSDRFDAKLEKYWRMMGFAYIDSTEQAGRRVHFAVMEA